MERKSIEVKIIPNRDALDGTESFFVENLLWGTKESPRMYAYLGFIQSDGFYIRMVCEESNPMRTYTKVGDPVYRDSAMEAFLKFEPEQRDRDGVYINLEVNANGALLAGYGAKRIYRSYFNEAECKNFNCKVQIKEHSWEARIHLPMKILEMVYGPLNLETGSEFACNFYKISETKEIEHYAAFSPILTEVPDFHRPDFFADAKLVK